VSKKRWFRFHIERWFKGTLGLTPNEIAAYVTVLCELYDNDGFAKLNCKVMARRCGMRPTSFQKAIDSLVSAGKLDIQGGFLTNKTVSEEIIEREKLGQKSAKSRAKVEQIEAENAILSREFAEKYPHKQRTNNKYTLHSSFTESENVELHPSVRDALARQKARKW
jgi:DNA-binding MarR family transcriptional regulator